MNQNIQNVRLLIVAVLSLVFSSASAQELKIIDKPLTAGFPFATIIAEKMQLAAPDSANSRLLSKELYVVLSAPDNKDKWVRMYFEVNRDNDVIGSVTLIGDVDQIVDLYVLLYDKDARKKFKYGDLRTAVIKDGDSITVTTTHKDTYRGVTKFWGAIKIEKVSH
jgi:hypothetical protein